MRVAVVTYLYPTERNPEAGVFVQQEVDALRRRHQFTLRVFPLSIRGRLGYLRRDRQVQHELNLFRPDLVHLHGGLALGPMRGWYGPRVVTFHGSDVVTWRGRCLARLLLRREDRVIVVANQLRRLLPSWVKTDVVSCGVDTRIFYAKETRPPLQRGDVVIGFPSAAKRREKNYRLFKKVIEGLRKKGWNVHEKQFAGLSRAGVVDALRETDCLVYTSLREGSPVLSKEALCVGCRVVGVVVGDLADQIRGLSGCAVSERDPEHLADLVERCLLSPGPDPEKAAKRFALETEADGVYHVYRAVLAGK